jgi:site-specific DNA-methyltransferase (adenine-specific)
MKKIHINNDDNYATPPEFYEELNKRFKFDFDPCPYNEKDIDIDGLNIEWGMSTFINPPYSQKLKEAFIKKGIEEMKKGKVCVFLIPVSTSTKLFHDYIKPNATEIEFVRGRIKFGKLDNDGNFYSAVNSKGKVQSGTKDSMIVVFDGRKNNSSLGTLLSKK